MKKNLLDYYVLKQVLTTTQESLIEGDIQNYQTTK